MKILYFVAAGAFLATACTPKTGSTGGATVQTNDDRGNSFKTTVNSSYMNKDIRPQEDFFQFSNGTWCAQNPVPASESRWGSFNELDQANKLQLTAILERAQIESAAKGKGSQSQLLGDYYTSYTNEKMREELGIRPVKIRLEKISRVRSREEIARIVAEQHKCGINSLFGFGVDQDLKLVEKHAVYIGQGGLGLPNRDYYLHDSKQKERDAYVQYVSTIFQIMGESENSAKSKAGMVLEFEKRLADSMMTPAQLRIPETQYNKMTFKEAKKLFPSFDFESYLTNLGCQSFDTIIVSQPAFLRQVNNLIGELPMEDWTTYLTWKTLNHYAGALDERCVKAKFDFYQRTLSGKKAMKPVNERAIDELTGSPLGELLGKAFVEVSYSEEAQRRVNEMVDNLLASFEDRIKGLEWMSDDTKKQALIKLNAIGRKLGFPEEWKDLSSIEISPTDYVGNLDNCARYATKENLAKLNKPVDKKEWGMPAHMVNAYYHPLLNEIVFPAGIMQPPFFDVRAEDAVNYGRIGMVIGHEFTHGFDDMGSKFAADGSFTNWWSENDRHLFEERTKTLGETFSGFCPIDGNCVNPDLTMGENIADLGGLTLAYYAYTRTDEFKKGEIRDGFTPAQRFFIAYAQLWKINYTDAELKNRIANDSHSPGMYRVNGPLMNCPEFFAAFDVKEGDKMRNTEKKVARIW